ncbi:methyl-accepting chemotaxis protein [Solimonas marina]|uniref:Methyl-accepting chemotaxis protein n=1 Tax=Solimonas marina TaxID=2714601 RepID=A0A970B7H1_9GAMM|nr:methyl-accepting chemotaxis protein [Solimonas marina]NKF23660.1 methyl-accepting chemotaxis protein [Solimonas marina]
MNTTLAYLTQLRAHADRMFLALIWLLLIASVGLAPWHETWRAVLLVGAPTVVLSTVQVRLWPGHAMTRVMIGCAFMAMSALMIHQGHGMIELHFGIFVLLAFLLLYRDWVPVIAAAAFIAVHHLGFDWLQRRGLGVWVFAANTGWHIVLIHALYVVLESAILCLIALNLRRESLLVGADPRDLAQRAQAMAMGDISGDATLAQAAPGSIAAATHELATSLAAILGEVRDVVQAQSAGDFSRRVGTDGHSGVIVDLAHDINVACERLEGAMQEAVDVLEAVGRGELERRIEFDGLGMLGRLQQQTNHTVSFLSTFCAEQQRVVDAAVRGELDGRVALDGLSGYQHELGGGINRLLDAVDAVMTALGQQMAALAEGDLRAAGAIDGQGRYAELADHVRASVEKLNHIVGEVRDGSDEIHTAAREIAAGNADLSVRTEQQASSLEETASSLEELTTSVQQSADNAHDAVKLTEDARQVAERGGAVVAQVVATMQNIHKSSRRIEEIIGVIDGIAFQTNILALNAAVEAARAGAEGRGFAVVAGEVRSLAQRSATAAREINELISQSVAQVDSGTALVQDAGGTMQSIVESIGRVAGFMRDIANTTREQSDGIRQINQAVTQMDQGTQQNAAMVEQAAAASKAMSGRAESLATLVARFRTEDRQAPVLVRSRAA